MLPCRGHDAPDVRVVIDEYVTHHQRFVGGDDALFRSPLAKVVSQPVQLLAGARARASEHGSGAEEHVHAPLAQLLKRLPCASNQGE